MGQLKKNAGKKEPQTVQKTNEEDSKEKTEIPEPFEFTSKFDEIQKNLELKKQNLNNKVDYEEEEKGSLIKQEDKPVAEKKVISIEEYKASLKKKAEHAKNPNQQEGNNRKI